MQFSCLSVHLSVCPWTEFCLELPLLHHSLFCDQNLLFDNALVGGMIMFSDSSSFSSAGQQLVLFRISHQFVCPPNSGEHDLIRNVQLVVFKLAHIENEENSTVMVEKQSW